MKQKIITMHIQPEPDHDRLLHIADKLLAPLTVLAMLVLLAVALFGLAHELGISDEDWTCVPVPVDGGLTSTALAADEDWVCGPPIPQTTNCPISNVEAVWDVPLADTELSALLSSCEAGHIDPALALALIQVESSFDPEAINPVSGCYGYCQLNPKYFPAGLSPEENITVGIGYLAEQLERYDNIEAALTAYNAGHDTGDRVYAQMVLGAMEDVS